MSMYQILCVYHILNECDQGQGFLFFLRMSMESATKIILNCSILNPHMTYKEWNFSFLRIIYMYMFGYGEIYRNKYAMSFSLSLASSRIRYVTHSAYSPCNFFLHGLIYFYIFEICGVEIICYCGRLGKRTCIYLSYGSIEYNSYT